MNHIISLSIPDNVHSEMHAIHSVEAKNWNVNAFTDEFRANFCSMSLRAKKKRSNIAKSIGWSENDQYTHWKCCARIDTHWYRATTFMNWKIVYFLKPNFVRLCFAIISIRRREPLSDSQTDAREERRKKNKQHTTRKQNSRESSSPSIHTISLLDRRPKLDAIHSVKRTLWTAQFFIFRFGRQYKNYSTNFFVYLFTLLFVSFVVDFALLPLLSSNLSVDNRLLWIVIIRHRRLTSLLLVFIRF